MKDYTVSELQTAHAARCDHYGNSVDWTLSDWGVALAGEVGEACNIIKKLRRGDTKPGLREALADELGDVLSYLCLVAQAAGIDLAEAHRQKFNRVNRRYQQPYGYDL